MRLLLIDLIVFVMLLVGRIFYLVVLEMNKLTTLNLLCHYFVFFFYLLSFLFCHALK